jgi:hypothetical protein
MPTNGVVKEKEISEEHIVAGDDYSTEEPSTAEMVERRMAQQQDVVKDAELLTVSALLLRTKFRYKRRR